MPLATTTARNALANAYKAGITHLALFTTVPGASAGTEVSGGSYARKPITWGATTDGVTSGTVTFDVPAGTTVAGWGGFNALTAGTYFDGGAVTSQNFATAGQYALTVTYTQS